MSFGCLHLTFISKIMNTTFFEVLLALTISTEYKKQEVEFKNEIKIYSNAMKMMKITI